MTFPSVRLYPSTTLFPSAVPLGTDGLGIVLGDLDLTNTDNNGVRWHVVSPLVGWDGSPANALTVTQKPRGVGGWLSPRVMAPRTITLNGYIDAPSADALQTAIETLNAASTLSDTVLTVQRGTSTRSVICCRQSEVLTSDLHDTAAQFSVQLIAADPRKFTTALSGQCALPSSTGGMVVPAVVPTVITSTVFPGTVSLTNPGNATGAVVVRVDGPCTGPIITHVGSGLQLTFASTLVLQAGEWLEIDMEAQTALANGQSSRNAYIEYAVSGFGWSGFEPGTNVWRVNSAAYNPASLFTITAIPAWQ